MHYTQKYCLVSFINPIEIGTEFSMENWPLHVTLADVFAIDLLHTEIELKLNILLSDKPVVKIFANQEVILGTTKVVLLDKTSEIIDLHLSLIELLEKNGAFFNSPEHIKSGFIPHCTIQKSERLNKGDRISIDRISLVDMYPDQDWQQRRVLKTFDLCR